MPSGIGRLTEGSTDNVIARLCITCLNTSQNLHFLTSLCAAF